jgi:hypothetical protein
MIVGDVTTQEPFARFARQDGRTRMRPPRSPATQDEIDRRRAAGIERANAAAAELRRRRAEEGPPRAAGCEPQTELDLEPLFPRGPRSEWPAVGEKLIS